MNLDLWTISFVFKSVIFSPSLFLYLQATIIVYQAVAEYWTSAKEPEYDLSVDILLPGRAKPDKFTLNNENSYTTRTSKVSTHSHTQTCMLLFFLFPLLIQCVCVCVFYILRSMI